jgi:2-hydroxychromene-2-carboxylate isomerase
MGALQAVETFAAERGILLAQLGAEQAVDLMLAFYKAMRADDVDMDADGDMLLFQQ